MITSFRIECFWISARPAAPLSVILPVLADDWSGFRLNRCWTQLPYTVLLAVSLCCTSVNVGHRSPVVVVLSPARVTTRITANYTQNRYSSQRPIMALLTTIYRTIGKSQFVSGAHCWTITM